MSPHSRIPQLTVFVLIVVSTICWSSAGAAWLVTKDGERHETRGQWLLEEDRVIFLDATGVGRSLPVAEVDFEESIAVTEREAAGADVTAERPDVIIYTTSWCGFCRRTLALLDELEVDYVDKDIERSAAARREHARLISGGGVPVLDIRGQIVSGYQPDLIRKLVAELDSDESSS